MKDCPILFPTMPANVVNIKTDLDYHGCAFVWREQDGTEWMIHPNRIKVYGEPKIENSAR